MIIPEICLACKWAIGNDCLYDNDCWNFSPSITCFEPKSDSSYSTPRNFLNQWLIVEATMENLAKAITKKKSIPKTILELKNNFRIKKFMFFRLKE